MFVFIHHRLKSFLGSFLPCASRDLTLKLLKSHYRLKSFLGFVLPLASRDLTLKLLKSRLFINKSIAYYLSLTCDSITSRDSRELYSYQSIFIQPYYKGIKV